MHSDHLAKASTKIHASGDRVWKALTDPQALKQYMFGADVSSDWRVGSPITWSGEFQGKPYKDTGKVLEADRGRRLVYSHASGAAAKSDEPASYHLVTIDLAGDGDETRVSLTQDNNPDEEARKHAEKNWVAMLDGLRKYVEGH